MTWEARVMPLMEHFEKLNARKLWEDWVKFPDSRQYRILMQYWLTPSNHIYLVQIYLDGSGWNVFKPVTESNKVADTLAAIV